jgi:hypothetical protein
MSTLNIGTNVQISGTNRKITGVLGAPGIIPTGAVIYTASNTGTGTPVGSIPPGYLPCDGAYYSKTLYPELYTAIRDTFNSNASLINPATGGLLTIPPAGTFRVPQLQGQFIRCWDGPVYTSFDPTPSGRIFASYQADTFAAHYHDSPSYDGQEGGYEVPTGGWNYDYPGGAPTSTVGGAETRPRNIALYAIIKY